MASIRNQPLPSVVLNPFHVRGIVPSLRSVAAWLKTRRGSTLHCRTAASMRSRSACVMAYAGRNVGAGPLFWRRWRFWTDSTYASTQPNAALQTAASV